MKRTLIILFLFAANTVVGQQFVYDTLSIDGLERDLILYVPDSYTPGTPMPLVMNFHGYSSNAGQQMFYGSLGTQAQEAGFLVVHPNGTLDDMNITHWNAGWGSTVDDVSFVDQMLDSLAEDYSIDQERIYSTGMSNGGFFSYYLACELGHRIAAIASVTGTMTEGTPATCDPTHPMPVMEIHGTADATVPYTGQTGFMVPIPDVIDHWVAYNNCNPSPTVTNVPDIDMTDGCTALHHHYTNGDDGVDVELYEVVGGGHTWPDALLDIGVTNRDFNASEVIWEFFNQYDINGRRPGVGIDDQFSRVSIQVAPNPSTDRLRVSLDQMQTNGLRIEIISVTGGVLYSDHASGNKIDLDISDLSPGLYSVRLIGNSIDQSTRFVKQ